MKLRQLLSLSALVLLLAGCPSNNPAPSAEAKAAAETPLIAPAGAPDPTIPAVPEPEEPKFVPPPADSPQYAERMQKWERAYSLQDVDAYPYVPEYEGRFLDKYPFFNALDCNIDNGGTNVWCTFQAQDNDISQAELATWVPYLSNRDALNPLLRCTSVCVDPNMVLVGAVQPEMQTWMAQHCEQIDGYRKCQ
jgi:hypothetical protein